MEIVGQLAIRIFQKQTIAVDGPLEIKYSQPAITDNRIIWGRPHVDLVNVTPTHQERTESATGIYTWSHLSSRQTEHIKYGSMWRTRLNDPKPMGDCEIIESGSGTENN